MGVQTQLFGRYLKDMPIGHLEWIGLRPAHKQPVISVERVDAIAGRGLEGDHRLNKTPGSARQVTLISQEHIQVIEQLLKKDRIDPADLRRNLVLSGINLQALRHQRFSIGEVIFEATAQCHPCSRMNKVLGDGAVAAMLGHGGLCAKIITGGELYIGAPVTYLEMK